MKFVRKVAATILSLVMLLTLIPISTSASEPDYQLTLVASQTTVTAGTEFTVDVQVLSAKSDYTCAQLTVDYDSTKVTYESATKAENLAVADKDGKIIITQYGVSKPVTNGKATIVTLTFKAKESLGMAGFAIETGAIAGGSSSGIADPVAGIAEFSDVEISSVAVTGVALNTTESELGTGKTLELKATVSPENASDKSVTWTSSNTEAATVDENGVVTAVAYSKEPVTITATTSDGSFSASCQIQTRFYDVTQALVDAGTISSGTFTRIYWAADNGIVLGSKDEKGVSYFDLTGDCTRAQMAVMFYRYAGKPEVSEEEIAAAKEKFSDVSSLSSGVIKSLAWAVSEGIIAGYNDGTFRPQNSISRASTVVMFWRMAGRPEAQGSSSFTDTDSCSTGVMKAINWAASVGITKGTANGDGTYRFAPNDNCQRQHIVTFIYRYDLLEK